VATLCHVQFGVKDVKCCVPETFQLGAISAFLAILASSVPSNLRVFTALNIPALPASTICFRLTVNGEQVYLKKS